MLLWSIKIVKNTSVIDGLPYPNETTDYDETGQFNFFLLFIVNGEKLNSFKYVTSGQKKSVKRYFASC